ncbi:methyltransferase domain-containing protein [Deinococcus pimensis]|uniref:methyltransferase domain-containing protein n=1 Tax=Deinococcus pimensis TaxID=309888 RepID=UPI00047F1A0F|nr:methyltransferase domain-containing protein [Deinococcus pimensis]
MPWNPDTYARFREERAAPFHDLLAHVRDLTPRRVIDLGCGSGELTAHLARVFEHAEVTGLDSSPEMLARAREHAGERLTFREDRIEDVDGEYDLVLSNAALQWVPNHHALLPRLWTRVAPGGALAVQVPSNFDHPTHRLLAETASEAPFADVLGGWTRSGTAPVGRQSPVLGIDEYAELLFGLGAADITAYEKVYPAVMADADGLLAWVSGTALVPYLERLGEHADAFREAYREKLWRRWPGRPVFYAFKRTLFVGRKVG